MVKFSMQVDCVCVLVMVQVSEVAVNNNRMVQADEPLPPGWAMSIAANGRPFFIDHNTKATTWVSEFLL